jgi:hypothetical protein
MNQAANQTNNCSMLKTSSTLLDLNVWMAGAWRWQFRRPLDNWHWQSIAAGRPAKCRKRRRQVRGCGRRGAILTSVGGRHGRPGIQIPQINAVIFADGTFVAVGEGLILTSFDAVTGRRAGRISTS